MESRKQRRILWPFTVMSSREQARLGVTLMIRHRWYGVAMWKDKDPTLVVRQAEGESGVAW